MQAHQAAFHPGPDGEYSDYRFTAPRAGSYSLGVSFTGIDSVGTTTDVHVLEGGSSLFNDGINGLGSTAGYSTTFTLAAGQQVDFAVGFGANGTYNNDSTAIDATLTFDGSSEPEPEGLVLLGMGSLGSFMWFLGRGRYEDSSRFRSSAPGPIAAA